MNHFDEMTCMLHLDGQLDATLSTELTAHARACTECGALLTALERESRLLGYALVEENEAVPARMLAPPAGESAPWGWMAAFGFISVAAYTLWTGVIEPWRQNLDQAGFGEESLLTMLFFRGVFWKGWESVQSLVQFSAVAILGALAVYLLRRNFRRFSSFAVVMAGLSILLMLPSPASAAEVRKNQKTFTLPASETVKTDLIVLGASVRIDGTVEGDLIAFCQSLTVNGHVKGDVIAFAQKTNIGGEIGGNVRVASNYLSVSGTVARNVMAFAENVDFDSKSDVKGSATLFGATTTLDGRIGRDILAFFRQGTLSGFVGGNAQMGGDSVEIGSAAVIEGSSKFRGNKEPVVQSGAKLGSPIQFEKITQRPDYLSPRYYLRQLFQLAAAFLVGLLLYSLMPGFVSSVHRACNRMGVSLGLGLIGLVSICILFLVAFVLIIFGVFAGAALLALAIPACYCAQIFVASWLGQKLLGAAAGTGQYATRLLLGLFIVRVVGLVPFAGGLWWCVVITVGLGGLILALYRRSNDAEPLPTAA